MTIDFIRINKETHNKQNRWSYLRNTAVFNRVFDRVSETYQQSRRCLPTFPTSDVVSRTDSSAPTTVGQTGDKRYYTPVSRLSVDDKSLHTVYPTDTETTGKFFISNLFNDLLPTRLGDEQKETS